MSITVVTTRDSDNVPTCYEKYELGTLWRVNGGNLEILAGRTLAALYPSGNWVSVFVDDAVLLHKGGDKPDYSGMPTVHVAAATRGRFEDPAGPPRPMPPNQPVVDGDAGYDPAAGGPRGDDGYDDGYDYVGSTPSPGDADPDVAAARSAMMPVAFRPKRYRAAPPPAKKAPTGPRMLPVRLRMTPFRLARDAEPAAADPGAPRMMPVTMRSTIYRAARPPRSETPPPEDETDGDTTDGDTTGEVTTGE